MRHHVAITAQSSAPAALRKPLATNKNDAIQRTGFDRTKISHLLPQLVAAGWADDYARHSRKHSGAPAGMRPTDGFAWISPEGRLALSMMRQLSPPIQVALASLGPVAERQLMTLLQEATAHGVSKQDVRRFEELLEEVATSSGPGRLEKAVNLVDLLQNSKELTVFFLVAVLPFLRSVVGG